MVEIIQDFIHACGGTKGMVMLTEDMTPEEKEMAVFKALVEDGYSPEEAARIAPIRLKEDMAIFASI